MPKKPNPIKIKLVRQTPISGRDAADSRSVIVMCRKLVKADAMPQRKPGGKIVWPFVGQVFLFENSVLIFIAGTKYIPYSVNKFTRDSDYRVVGLQSAFL